jgi:hypothetical protein
MTAFLRPQRTTGRRRWVGAVAAAAALTLSLVPAQAEDAHSYADHVKAVLARILGRRDFKPEAGCDEPRACETLLQRLRGGTFRVIEPNERSDAPDMPSYLRLRQKCRELDLAHMGVASHRLTATRNFAIYRLELAAPQARRHEILVFRAQHYVKAADPRVPGDGPEDETSVWPGTFVAIDVPRCRVLANAIAEEGDRFAKHIPVNEDEHLSEIVQIDDGFFVLNLAPIIAGREPEEAWWYKLELAEWGGFRDTDPHKRRPTYAFTYKPPGEEH